MNEGIHRVVASNIPLPAGWSTSRWSVGYGPLSDSVSIFTNLIKFLFTHGNLIPNDNKCRMRLWLYDPNTLTFFIRRWETYTYRCRRHSLELFCYKRTSIHQVFTVALLSYCVNIESCIELYWNINICIETCCSYCINKRRFGEVLCVYYRWHMRY